MKIASGCGGAAATGAADGPVPSSVIRCFDYDPLRRELLVTLITGRRYLYANVPPDAAESFRSAFSKGRHFNAYVRDRFPCREVTDA